MRIYSQKEVFTMRSAFLALPALAVLACLPSLAHAQTIITTIPASNSITINSRPIVGETFTAPTDNILNSFAFQLDQTTALTFSVYAYNQAANVTVGPALFTSAPATSTTVQGSNGYTFNTGNLVLTTGSVYAALLSGTSPYTGPAVVGPPDAYTGGTIVYSSSITSTFIDVSASIGRPADLAFRASFSSAAVPEPGSVALLVGLGVSGAGLLVRRRQRVRKAA